MADGVSLDWCGRACAETGHGLLDAVTDAVQAGQFDSEAVGHGHKLQSQVFAGAVSAGSFAIANPWPTCRRTARHVPMI
jgi:hypothetical protein